MNILQLLASLSILVFIHELGHYTMARLFGTRVEKFYLFFNPWFSLLKWKSPRSGTIYGLGWLPLGGYCQIAGMVDESMDSEQLKSEPKPDEFRSKTAWQRLLIMAGGILFNLILAFFIYVSIAFAWGDKYLDSSKVSGGWAFSPVAEEVGFRKGDIILSVNGERNLNALDSRFLSKVLEARVVEVQRGSETLSLELPSDMMQRLLRAETGFAHMQMPFVIDSLVSPTAIQSGLSVGATILAVAGKTTEDISEVQQAIAEHKGETITLTTTLGEHQVQVSQEGTVGLQARPITELYPIEQLEYNLFTAIPAGYRKATDAIGSYVGGLKYVFTKEGAQSLGGLGTMAKLFPAGFDWQAFWMTTAFLSVILAVMNLLPIPALDGGHILFLLIEMITRRKLSDKVMMYIQTVGMVLLFLLMLYANGNDIYRYFIR